MDFEDQILIAASADLVWSVYADVERWPEWTASTTSVDFVVGTTLALGAKVRIRQPRLPTAVWEVTALDPGRSWTWEARGPGVHTTAFHTLEPGDGGVLVRQGLSQAGPLGGIVGRLWGRLTRAYLAMEAEGLKDRCESAPS